MGKYCEYCKRYGNLVYKCPVCSAWLHSNCPCPRHPNQSRSTLSIQSCSNGSIRINGVTIEDYPYLGNFHYGKWVKIEAIPDENYQFVKWTIDGVDYTTNPRILVMTKDMTLSVTFAPKLQLTINSFDNGTVKLNGQTVSEGVFYFNTGQTVVLEAIPDQGYEFAQWAEGKTENPWTFQIEENTEITPEFSKNGVYTGYSIKFLRNNQPALYSEIQENDVVTAVTKEGELITVSVSSPET